MSKIFYTVIITIIVSYINFGQTRPTTFYPLFNEGLSDQLQINPYTEYGPESVTLTGDVG